MDIKRFPIFLRCLSASLTHSISFSGECSLLSPEGAVVSIISPFISGMKVASNVFRAPFTATLIVTKKMFGFIFFMANVLLYDWRAAVRAGRAPGRSFYFYVSPSPSTAAFPGTCEAVVNSMCDKFIPTYKTILANISTLFTIITSCPAPKRGIALLTDFRKLSSWHFGSLNGEHPFQQPVSLSRRHRPKGVHIKQKQLVELYRLDRRDYITKGELLCQG